MAEDDLKNEQQRQRVRALYGLENMFDTLTDQDGRSVVTRVPGGWIFYTWSDIRIGEVSAMCFVPFSDEFEPDRIEL